MRIQMLGGFAILGPDARLDLSRQQTGALLARLATKLGQEVPREELLLLLWPDATGEEARARLRQRLYSLGIQLSNIRPEGDQALRASRDSVSLDPAIIESDLAEFENQVFDGIKVTDLQTRVSHLESALALYQGPMLPGFYQDYFVQEQERVTDLYWKALLALSLALEASGKFDQALPYARQMVATDPLSEECCCLTMRLLGALGRPQEAVRQFESLEKALKTQMDVSPSESVKATMEKAMRVNGSTHAEADRHEPDSAPTGIGQPEPRIPKEPTSISSRPRKRVFLGLGLVAAVACALFLQFSYGQYPTAKPNGFTKRSGVTASVDYSRGFSELGAFAVNYHQDYGNGFTGPQFSGGALRLIDGHIGESSSVWLKKKLDIRGFSTSFRFKATNPPNNPGILADGFTFTAQTERPNAMGGSGGSLGYAGVPDSFCLAIYFHRARDDQPLTKPTWGFFMGGHPPLETMALPLDIGNGDFYRVELTYDGKDSVVAKITDERTGQSADIVNNLPVSSIAATTGGLAWVGFTGGTGMGWADLQILDWTFTEGK